MAEDWIAVIKKETTEEDSMPFAKSEGARTVKTTRTWFVNSSYPDAIKLLEKVPET